MISLKVEGFDQALEAIRNGEKHARFVTMRAMNDLSFTLMREGRTKLTEIFDRPTRYTTSSWFVRKKATKDDLHVEVGMTDYLSSKRLSEGGPDKKLYHHFYGGERSRKGIEMHLQRRGLLNRGEWLVIGKGARTDAYGNISPGQIAQIMSQLGLSDSTSRSTNSTRSRRNVARAGRFFWSPGTGRTAHLPRGVWQVTRGGIKPILIVVSATRYRKRLDLDAFGAVIVKRDLDALFAKHWARARATER